ncbi:MAG: hypothetical protein ACRD27_12420, partial [Terracidiphilus sp.]
MARRASRHERWLLVALAALLLAAQPSLRAQTFDATHITKPTDLSMTWLVHAGDNPAYTQPDFDDSHWARFDPGKSLKTVFPSARPQIVWYRLHVKVAPSQTGLALAEQ